ncbi:MbtH family protein [Streptomyces sp. NPDC058439]|uniref:MbtH family protein n=1 Tax=unclassified Streptomyces TaxID=2593676 RepID=UPI00364A7F93
MTNPFENPDSSYLVLVNDEGQHSVWPASIDVPDGWTVAKTADTRDACLAFVEENWTDMRPASLVKAMTESGA